MEIQAKEAAFEAFSKFSRGLASSEYFYTMNTNIRILFWPIVFSSIYVTMLAFESIVGDNLVH